MLKKVVLGLAALVLVLVVVVAMQPAEYRVERSRVVPASPEVTYAVLADFDRFEEWSPWAELDPNMKKTVEGTPGTAGYRYAWTGNQDVGKGSMVVKQAKAPERIDIELEFVEPFASVAQTSYILEPVEGGTKVTWTMAGDNDFMGKAMGLMMDMDAMIGADYDKGLAKLEPIVKAEADAVALAKKKAEEAAKAAAEAEATAEAPAQAAN